MRNVEEVLRSMHKNLEKRNKKEANQRQFEGVQRKMEQMIPGPHKQRQMKWGPRLHKVEKVSQLDRIILYWLAKARTAIQVVKVKIITGQENWEICRDNLVIWDSGKKKKIVRDGLENGSDQRKVKEESPPRRWKERKKLKEK